MLLTTDFQNTQSKKMTKLKREIEKIIIILENFSTLLSVTELVHRKSTKKIRKLTTT